MKHEQAYYDEIKQKFADERDLRLKLRPEGTSQFTSDLSGDLRKYAEDPYVTKISERAPINDSVEVLFIGGGFSALLSLVLSYHFLLTKTNSNAFNSSSEP